MIVKVCGMKYADNIRLLDEAKIAQWMGFIFYPKSPRYVSEPPSYLPQYSQRVGVFVNASIDDILAHHADYQFNLIQLHGNESPDYCQRLRTQLNKDTQAPQSKAIQLIKALPVSSMTAYHAVPPYIGSIDYLLFETPTTKYGGTGTKFDWSLLNSYQGPLPFLLTGGIGPDDAQQICAIRHPQFCGIDLNSRFETAPAKKDIAALSTFMHQLNGLTV